jgi:cyclopropane fatty-acyl-phospholipid synthase-like methyltransferase
MPEQFDDQKKLWEAQHESRKEESREIENTPNLFAKRCVELLPENALIVEIGAANGRDARFFAREKNSKVVATDFSLNALKQLREASERDDTADKVFPVVADTRELPLGKPESVDAFYSRSALHLTDEELDHFFEECMGLLKDGGYVMVEGKTEEDPKMATSKEVSPHLYENGGGHLRRSWNEAIIHDLIEWYGLHLIEINKTTEVWHDIETKFINFIAQKIKEQ